MTTVDIGYSDKLLALAVSRPYTFPYKYYWI